MKYLFIILCTISSVGCAAQFSGTATPAAGSYTTNANLNKFVGTWIAVGASGHDTARIVLTKQKVHFQPPFNFDVDMLVGWHSYKNSAGTVVESNLSYVGSNYYGGHSSLYGATNIENPNTVPFMFTDLTKHKHGTVSFKLVTGSLTQANWSLTEVQGLRTGLRGFTVPTTLLFTKQ